MILGGFGATPIQGGPAGVDRMVADGSLRVAESSFNGITTLSGTPTGTGDVVLYPKYQVLAAEDSAFSRLTPEQQAIVRDAAHAARDLAIAKHVPDARSPATGARLAVASCWPVQEHRDVPGGRRTGPGEDGRGSPRGDRARGDPRPQGTNACERRGRGMRAHGHPMVPGRPSRPAPT